MSSLAMIRCLLEKDRLFQRGYLAKQLENGGVRPEAYSVLLGRVVAASSLISLYFVQLFSICAINNLSQKLLMLIIFSLLESPPPKHLQGATRRIRLSDLFEIIREVIGYDT
jgi:hypothetical protein